jgi:hypothetical protein
MIDMIDLADEYRRSPLHQGSADDPQNVRVAQAHHQ